MVSFFGKESTGKYCQGYCHQLNILKLFGRCFGLLDRDIPSIISVLRFFIFLKASPSHFTSMELETEHMIPILLVPCWQKRLNIKNIQLL